MEVILTTSDSPPSAGFFTSHAYHLPANGIQCIMAIQSFSDADTKELFTTGKCKRFAAIAAVATRKLTQLESAPTCNFMALPPGNDLKFYDDAWHVRINLQWRLTFKWGDDGPYDVLIEDPH